MKHSYLLLIFSLLFLISSCETKDPISERQELYSTLYASAINQEGGCTENFETASKGSYATAEVTLSSGNWVLEDALLGTSTSDPKNDAKSVRVRESGALRMSFDLPSGANELSFYAGTYGTNGSSSLQVYYSTNQGTSWNAIGDVINVSQNALTQYIIPVNLAQSLRFEIRKISGGSNRVNIDDLSTTPYSDPLPSRDDVLALGNPSLATTFTTDPTNYLMDKGIYSLSYNATLGHPNWVAWHLSPSWKGDAPRQNNFSTDNTLPSSWYHVTTNDYKYTGFDRGHLCPSEDRDFSAEENSTTFLMTNMFPQAPNNNRQTWLGFENYLRDQMNNNQEVYIIAGGIGSGGSGSNGGITYSFASGKVNVPAYTYKIALILPTGSFDLHRINSNTRIVAIKVPNTQAASSLSWENYRVSVDAIEAETGFNFFSEVNYSIQEIIEAQVDSQNIM